AKQEKQPIYPVQFENHRLNGYRFDISVAVHCLYDIERIKDRGKYSRFFGILHHLALINRFTLNDCLAHAYDQIKDRKGEMQAVFYEITTKAFYCQNENLFFRCRSQK
ncbi:hypothetical protein P2K15_12205, partial [Mannheimia haemolytica]|nr:hypothetical protein [Mannheimia haemolytica]